MTSEESKKLLTIAKEVKRLQLFEEIKNTKDVGLIVDVLYLLITTLDDQSEKFTQLETINKKIAEIKEEKKGDKGDKPVAGIDYPIPQDGKDYILTNRDKKEIAAKIKVPVVEKVIEKTEVIKEQPIITNEIKEVAVSDTGQEIVKKINNLPTNEDDYLIEVEHIKGLKKAVEKWGRSETHITSGGGKGRIKPYDISSQLNGVTKTFNLPANWTVVSVVSGSFPNAFRPIIDYTFTPTSITFTSEITAGTTLASGQTVIVIYEEA